MKTNKPARTDVLKVILSAAEIAEFRRKCASVGVSCSPTARQLINEWRPAHSRPRQAARERPWHGHVALPSRANHGGAPMPRLRV